MSKSKKSLLVVLAAILAFALSAAFLLFSLPITANAERSSTAWTTIGEIYNDSTQSFNLDNLNKLYKALSGETTFSSVQIMANSGNKTSADFRTKNGGTTNVSVWFGGKKWDAVYLTTAQNGGVDTQKGDIILDLWQSADTVTTRAGFAEWETAALDTNTDIYPVNLYSASKMRVETLNAGGYYSTDANTLVSNKQGQNSGNQYARFTMSTVDNSLTEYIAKPSEVGYQEKEFNEDTAKSISKQSEQAKTDKTNGDPYYLPNDAYGTPSGGQWFDSDFGNLYNKDDSRNDEAKYGAWQNDYLWLPSITEVGCSADANGLWNTDISLRSSVTVNDGYVDEGSYAWLRSGFCSNEAYKIYGPSFVYVMGVNADSANHADWTSHTKEMNLVRPALHLNLSAANRKAESAWKSVGEIYQDSSNSFNAANVKALYSALTGDDGKYSSLKEATKDNNVLTSSDFREKNGGQNVQVTFGGIKWDVVYLTRDKNDNVILDLWQSVDNITLTREWAGKNNASNNLDHLYPDNMYSSSTIRVIALNAGGKWASDNDAITSAGQSSSSPYARFTMDSGIANSLTNYIVKPADVSYQETEFDSTTAKAVSSGCYLPNDAYGTPTGGKWYDDKFNYKDKGDADDGTSYDAWKNDYIWLPSITETGCSASGTGYWKTDAALRNSGGVAVWTRSGDDNWAANAYALEPTGNNQHYYVNYSYAVRPAIHLNLTAIKNAITTPIETPVISSKTYTGHPLTASIVTKLGFATVSNEGGTDVGTYDVVLTLTDEDNYRWQDSDELQIKLTFEITTAKNEWTNGGIIIPNDGEGWTYGDEIEHTPLEPTAPAKFDSVNDERATMTYYNDKDGKPDTSPLEGFPINAGTYWVKATVPARQSKRDTSQKNYNELVSDPVCFEIKKAELTRPTATDSETVEGIYSGTPYQIEISGYKSDTMTATLDESGKSSFEGGKFAATNAGKYTLTITITDQNNYKWTDGESDVAVEFTIEIAQKELEKPTGSAGGAYNGEEYVVTLTNYDNATMKTSEVPKGSTFKEDGGTWKFSAVDVGTYSITIFLRYPDNYKWKGEGADPEITITIGKTQLSFKLKESRKTYTGSQHSDIDVIFEGDFGHLTIDEDYTLSFTEIDGKLDGGFPKGAGSYTVKLTLTGSALQDYNLKESTATYEIVKADLTFELIKSEGEYTGATHSDIDVNFTGKYDEFTKDEDYTLVFEEDGGKLEGSLPKGAGGYNVKVKLSDEHDKNYNVTTVSVPYKINKAKITVSGEYTDSRDYNGKEYSQTLTASDKGLQIVMSVNDPEFEITIATEKWADTYTGKITVEYDDVNFALTNSGTYTVTINKAKLTLSLTVTDGGKTYNGNNIATVTGEIVSGKYGSDNVTIAEIIANFNDKNVGEGKEITVTKVTLGGAMADNYTVVIDDLFAITGNIAKKTVEVVWDGYEGLIYGGNPQTITASATGVMIDGHAEEVILAIAYSAEAGSTLNESDLPQNAGTYTATASTADGNYALSKNSITYTVAKRQVDAPTIASKVYNRAPQTADVGESELYEVTENIGGTVVDNYNVKLTLTDSKNYTWTTSDEAEITLIFTITKATYDMSGVTFEDFSIIYDGEEHSIFIVGDLPFEEVTVRYENNGQTAVGDYIITAIFEGDADNYELIPNKTATLTILKVSHDLDNIIFADVKVKYDGEAHSIFIDGELPTNVTVAYEGNGQVEPNIYTITAIFSDPDGVFDSKTATLTILRTQTQTAPKEESGSGGLTGGSGSTGESGSGESGGGESGSGGSAGESGEGDIDIPEVFIESEEGFDPTLELVVEKAEDTSRSYLAWGADEVSEKYSVKLCNQDGEEVPIEGKVTVRLLIPEAFRNKDFDLMALAKSGAASAASTSGIMLASAPIGTAGPTSVKFTRDGDYVVFEADGLSEYVFTSSYTPYFPILIIATGALLADVAAMIVLTVVIRKKRSTKVR